LTGLSHLDFQVDTDMTKHWAPNSYCLSRICSFLALSLVVFFPRGTHASEALWSALEEGGKVVLMRHAPVKVGTDAGSPLVRDPSCRRERNLSLQGKRQAREIGRKFAQQRVPVSQVLHSPFCRTTETAQLAFGEADPAGYLSLLEVLEPEEAERQTLELSTIIGSYSGSGNLVLVTHEPNISAVSFELLRHLDLLILEPTGGSEFEEMGVIRFSDEN
jgi:phosphohistidine phosphatase SixA